MPRHKSQIRVCALITDQVWFACLLEMAVDHAEDAADLVAVAVEAVLPILFGVVEDEPGSLAEVWT